MPSYSYVLPLVSEGGYTTHFHMYNRPARAGEAEP